MPSVYKTAYFVAATWHAYPWKKRLSRSVWAKELRTHSLTPTASSNGTLAMPAPLRHSKFSINNHFSRQSEGESTCPSSTDQAVNTKNHSHLNLDDLQGKGPTPQALRREQQFRSFDGKSAVLTHAWSVEGNVLYLWKCEQTRKGRPSLVGESSTWPDLSLLGNWPINFDRWLPSAHLFSFRVSGRTRQTWYYWQILGLKKSVQTKMIMVHICPYANTSIPLLNRPKHQHSFSDPRRHSQEPRKATSWQETFPSRG